MAFKTQSLMQHTVIYEARRKGVPIHKATQRQADLKKYFWLRNFGLFETAVIECSICLPHKHWMRLIVEDDGY